MTPTPPDEIPDEVWIDRELKVHLTRFYPPILNEVLYRRVKKCVWEWKPPVLAHTKYQYDELGHWKTACGKQTILGHTGEQFCQFCGGEIQEVSR